MVDSVRHLSPGEQRVGTCRDDRMVSDLHPRCYDPIHVTAKASRHASQRADVFAYQDLSEVLPHTVLASVLSALRSQTTG